MDIKLYLYIVVQLLLVLFCSGEKPKLIDHTSKKIKPIGALILLSCTFENSQDVAWLKDGKQLKLSSRIYTSELRKGAQKILNIENIQAADAGVYTCVGSNSDGQARGEIELDVILNYKPRIRAIGDVYLLQGGSLDVECNSEAIPTTVTYKWEKVGGGINGASVAVEDNVLKLSNISPRDSGLFKCIASNSEGSSIEAFSVKIVGASTQWIDRPVSRSVESSERFEWVASIATRHKPVFKWYKDGSFILRESSMTQVGAKFISRLSFPDLSLADAGEYKVMVENLEFSDWKSDMILTVFAPPTVLINEGEEVELHVGDTLNLVCNMEGNPTPTIAWLFNGSVLTSVPANGTKVLPFYKKKVTLQDKGEYMCVGANDRGNSTASVNVIVYKRWLTTAVKITLIVVLVCVIIIVILGCVFFYWKYGETCLKVALEHTFYTDLVEEEKDLSSLHDLENNPNTIKKNINKSIKRSNTTTTTTSAEPEPTSTFQAIKRLSTKKRPPMQKQTSIFDTINAKQREPSRRGTFSLRPRTSSDGHGARLASVDLVQGKSIDVGQLTFEEVVAEGEYGGVTRGSYAANDDMCRDVSIKMLKDELLKSAEKRNMLTEIRLMRRIKCHENIVEFIGWSVSPGCVCIVEELMPFGSLLDYLRAQTSLADVDAVEGGDGDVVVTQHALLSFAQQIAAGMIHLSQLQVVHRDLACRNVYIDHENLVKISDYSIVRDVYTPNVYRQTTGGQLPVRWMAYEAIFNGEYTSKTDVWSFGVLLWELCTLGDIPYPNLIRTEQLLEELERGYRMENPGNISTDLFLLMDSCWNKLPTIRPTFNKLYADITALVHEEEDDVVHIDTEGILHEKRNKSSFSRMTSQDGNGSRIPTFASSVLVEEDEEASERDPCV